MSTQWMLGLLAFCVMAIHQKMPSWELDRGFFQHGVSFANVINVTKVWQALKLGYYPPGFFITKGQPVWSFIENYNKWQK